MKTVNISDYRLLARKRVPRFLFDYLDGAAVSEVTKAANTADLASICLNPRVLRDVSTINTATTLAGQACSMPIVLAPVGLAGMYARRGEIQAARAAEAKGIPFTLSTVGVCSLQEVDEAVAAPFWFQLYMARDRGFMRDLLALASESQVSVLVLTVDMPTPGIRYRDYRSGLAGESWLSGNIRRLWQAAMRPRWALDVGIRGRPHALGNVAPLLGNGSGLEDFMAWMQKNFDRTVTWRDLEFVREHWGGPVLVKGVMHPEDALEAAALEVDGIVVSNHGGRQLDGVRSTCRALPEISRKVGDRLDVLVDGGVTSGIDVLRFIALGARGVMIGRSWVYGLAARGRAGVEDILEILARELHVSMALAGLSTIADVDSSLLSDGVARYSQKP